jgi:acyl-CoA thioester hydrolase
MYLYASPVHFDELDANGVLHNARYALHVEHAQSALSSRPSDRDGRH